MDILGRDIGVEARFRGIGEDDMDRPRGIGWGLREEGKRERPREVDSLVLGVGVVVE